MSCDPLFVYLFIYGTSYFHDSFFSPYDRVFGKEGKKERRVWRKRKGEEEGRGDTQQRELRGRGGK